MKSLTTLGALFAAGMMFAAPAAQAGDAAAGEKIFKRCTSCHSTEAGKHRIGPSLHDVVGNPAGSADGYTYSKLFQSAADAGLSWTPENLTGYLMDPTSFLTEYVTANGGAPKGRSKMAFRLRKEDQISDVISYLETVK